MQDVVRTGNGALARREIREIALDELGPGEGLEIAPLAGDETVQYAYVVTAAEDFFSEMGADESSTARNEIEGHGLVGREPCARQVRDRLHRVLIVQLLENAVGKAHAVQLPEGMVVAVIVEVVIGRLEDAPVIG